MIAHNSKKFLKIDNFYKYCKDYKYILYSHYGNISNFNSIILEILNLHNPTHISFYGIEIRTDERFYFP